MARQTVIVFGATGSVGSTVARTAGELGANVVLAMRDTSKLIPGLGTDLESSGTYQRVQADLTKPEMVFQAVTQTKAKKAFIYLVYGTSDHMKGAIEALKSAGIMEVVFLSTASVRGRLEQIPPEHAVPYAHAQVEINLEKVFGPEGHYSLRPGTFVTNLLRSRNSLSGHFKINGTEMTTDAIVPEDIGRVGATVLLKGTEDQNRHLYLYGPEVRKISDLIASLAGILGKECKIEPLDKEEEYRTMVEVAGRPPSLVRFLVDRNAGKDHDDAPLTSWGYALTEPELKNIEKYSGVPGTSFEEWARKNKGTLF